MENLKFRAMNVAYHVERLSKSKTALKAVEEKDEESFVKACRRLHIPEKYLSSLMRLTLSVGPEQTWPW